METKKMSTRYLKIYLILMLILLTAAGVSAKLIVHVQNPWAGEATFNDKLRMFGTLPEIKGAGWEGGAVLMKGGNFNNWYSMTFDSTKSTKKSNVNIDVVRIKGQNWNFDKKSIGSLSTLFNGSTDEQNEVWVTLNPLTVTLNPFDVGASVINVLNPWPENSPKLIIDSDTIQMSRNNSHTGWYSHVYTGDRNNLEVLFTDYYNSEYYGQTGKGDAASEKINLTPYKDSGNTLYIWPEPKYDGPARVSGSFPNVFGEPDTMVVTALVRDWSINDTAFEENFSSDNVSPNIAGEYLDANGKIQKGSSNAFKSADMPSWFETKILGPDLTNETCIEITMKKSDDGGWMFDSKETGGFFPIDDFDPYGEGHYKGHNFSFTMEMRTQFEYREGKGQVFEFKGDDDVWVYINGKLAIDLGGPHPALRKVVKLDSIKTDFNLENGKNYTLAMFYCERECWEPGPEQSANFFMKTTLNLENISALITEEIVVGDSTEIIIKKLESGDFGNDCGINVNDPDDIDTIEAQIETYILTGPYFNSTSPDTLPDGLSYGGIYIDPSNKNHFSVQPNKITELTSGEYTLTYIDNGHFSGKYKFTVLERAPVKVDTAGTEVSADPDEVEYEALTLTVNLSTDDDCVIHYEVLQGNIAEPSTGLFDGTGALNLDADTVKIKTWALGNSSTPFKITSDTAVYTFIRNLPDAEIVADSSVEFPNSLVFTTGKYPVTLKIVSLDGNEVPLGDDVKLWYALGNADPAGATPYLAGDTIWLTSSDTIRATADLTSLKNPEDGIWAYTQQLKDAALEADPGSNLSTQPFSYNTAQMSVKLKTTSGDTIYYSIASLGGSAGDFGSVLADSGNVTITGSDTIWAYADGPDSKRFDTVWTYSSDLPEAWITADPSESPEFLFGHSLSIDLNSNADTIRYSIDGSPVDENSTLFIPGTDIISIDDSHDDVIVVSGFAYGDNFAAVRKEWRYVRDTLPLVVADPAGKKFSGTLDIDLATSGGVDAKWENLRIFYTLDGSEPDTNSSLYSSTLTLNNSVTVKARAYADNRIESPVMEENYTLVARAVSAWYQDRSGDGAVDFAVILLNKEVDDVPDNIVLTNPFDSTDTRTVSAGDITLESSDRLVVSISNPFPFNGETGFDAASLGHMEGAAYEDGAEIILEDSVAPVIVSADFHSGEILETGADIKRANDTLNLLFSEDITISDWKEPFEFTQNGFPYRVVMDNVASTIVGREGIFIVESVVDAENPVPGDLVHFSNSAQATAEGAVQSNPDNRWVELTVHEPPYALIIKALSPVNPDSALIPESLTPEVYRGATALMIVADFMMKLWDSEGVAAEVSIFDPLGNIVSSVTSIGTGEDLVAEVRTDPRTMVVIYWNGRNSKGRRVAGGHYLAAVTITAPDGRKVEKRIPIGIIK